MADNPEVTQENLEEMTNKLESPQGPATPPESATPDSPTPPEGQVELVQEPAVAAGQPDLTKLSELLADTPFKADDPFESVQKLKDGYKNLQGEFDRRNQETKPYKPLLERLSDPQFAEFVNQAQWLYDAAKTNPNILQAYTQPQSQTPPDPRKYYLDDPEQLKAYNEDLNRYVMAQNAQLVDSRLAQIEQKHKEETWKAEFRQTFPKADVDEIIPKMKTLVNQNPYVLAYKALNFDTAKTQALEEARKEVTQKLETASKTATPTPSGTGKQQVNPEQVIDYIVRYGDESANKKFGHTVVRQVLQQFS